MVTLGLSVGQGATEPKRKWSDWAGKLVWGWYRRCDTHENTSQRTDHLQCGSGDQYRCSLHHYAVRRNCPGKKVYQLLQWKRPDVPCTGTDKEIPERTWICTDKEQMGLCKTPEYRTGQEGCRSSHKICKREPCRYNYFRIPGDKRKDIGKKETEAASVEKKGYPEKMWTSGTSQRDADIQDLCMEYQQACIWWVRNSCPWSGQSQSLYIPEWKKI